MNEIMTQLYGDNPELMTALRQIIAIFPRLMPSLLVIFAGIESYLNYSLCYSVTRKFFPRLKNLPAGAASVHAVAFSRVNILCVIGSVRAGMAD